MRLFGKQLTAMLSLSLTMRKLRSILTTGDN
ncbi:hypothetical protein CPL00229_CDS0022 [Escherichia phage vB_Eco_mar004NP2]